MNYLRLSEGLKNYKLVPATDNIWDHIKSNESEYYVSLYQYNDKHYEQWKSTKTVSGIKDTTTDRLLWDFDAANDIESARQDAITLSTRLLSKGIKADNIQVSFSGNKGFNVELLTNKSFTQEEFKNITFALASDLPTFDKVVNDSNRIIRLVGTKHAKSGLYKIPLTVNQLSNLDVPAIKTLAKSLDNIDNETMEGWHTVELPESIASLKYTKKVEKVEAVITDLDLTKKPKWLSDAKYALQEGYFGAGERNTAFMVLASTYKNQGFNKEIVYRALKGVAEVQASRNNVERYSDKELWVNVVEVVFNPNWKGGQYSYENTPLLQDITKRLGLKAPGVEDNVLVPVDSVTNIFRDFAINIDKNTIKLGIDSIDKEVRITTSMLVGLLAPPSAGKTTISLGILNSLSKSNLKAMFFSLDMGAPLVYQRLIQRHTGISGKKIFEMYKTEDKRLAEFEKLVSDNYKNVHFCFRSGVTVDSIRQMVLDQEQKDGERVKLIVIDYLECLSGPYSDSTANTAFIAQQLKDIANDLQVTVLLLLQPQKSAGDPSSELLSYRSIKGASVIEQACSVVLTMWRPGFSPKSPADDKYLTIAVVKNRMGSLNMFDFRWDGLTGTVSEMEDEDVVELEELRKRKAAEKAAEDL